MFPLNKSFWINFEHAYGTAEDIPLQLNELMESYTNSIYSDLFTKLCHQGSIYNSSFVAVPYLLEIAKKHKGKDGLNILFLISAIQESATEEERKKIGEEVLNFYDVAILEANKYLDLYCDKNQTKDDAIYIIIAKFAFQNELKFSKVLEGFSNEEFYCTCQSCSEEIFIWPKNSTLVSYENDPVFKKDAKNTLIEPSSKLEGNFETLMYLARALNQKYIQDLTPYLAGSAICPHCSFKFNLYKQIEDEVI